MPFYEYKCVDPKLSCKFCIEKFEIYHSIMMDALDKCPECNNKIERQVSLSAGFILKGRQVNQYNDVKHAKYWRDKDGVKHKVTPGDGHSNSPTTPNRQTKSDEQIKAMKKMEAKINKQKRINTPYSQVVKRQPKK